MSGNIRRLARLETPPLPELPHRRLSRRALHRVETGAMDIQVGVHTGAVSVHGQMVNVSVSGCCIRLALPLPVAFDEGLPVRVTLPVEDFSLLCRGEVVTLDGGSSGGNQGTQETAVLRLRFRSLAPQVHRTLVSWIGELARREFQSRHATDTSR